MLETHLMKAQLGLKCYVFLRDIIMVSTRLPLLPDLRTYRSQTIMSVTKLVALLESISGVPHQQVAKQAILLLLGTNYNDIYWNNTL